jgi:DNA-binding SARP family transcriptional activator
MDVTSRPDGVRILGPLEARFGGEPIPLGGAKQRALLALLLLNVDEVVSVERLVEELWGDDPPAAAGHSVEAYVSRLRQLLGPLGLEFVRRGHGYLLVLGEAWLDAVAFAELHEAAAAAAADGDDAHASELASRALALWRSSPLADVALRAWGSIGVSRLAERRLQAAELRADAGIRLGRHEELVAELPPLIAEHPYGERLVALLMLALYRSGRQAESLAVYEALRLRLAQDLGLQPSAELQQLSGRVVRHDPSLRSEPRPPGPSRSPRPRPRRRALLAAGVLAAAAVVLAAGGSVREISGAAPAPHAVRIALVLPHAAGRGADDAMRVYETRLRDYLYLDDTLALQTIVARDVEAATSALERGRFELVLWVGDGSVARGFAPRVAGLAPMRFVFLDASLTALRLRGVANASTVRFAEEEASELVGYMSGLVEARGSAKRADRVSVIADGSTAASREVVKGFRRGVARANRDAAVLVAYVGDGTSRSECEQLANTQIDKGSDAIFVTAGSCGAAAAAVARLRNVWAVGGAESVPSGRHLLVRADKLPYRAVDVALLGFEGRTLPAGGETVLGLAEDYAVGISETNPAVPGSISSAVVRLCSSIREHTRRDAH